MVDGLLWPSMLIVGPLSYLENFVKGCGKTPPFVLQNAEGEQAQKQASRQAPQASPGAPGSSNHPLYGEGGTPHPAGGPTCTNLGNSKEPTDLQGQLFMMGAVDRR